MTLEQNKQFNSNGKQFIPNEIQLNFNGKQFISVEKGNTHIDFLPSGDIFQILHGDILINQYLGNCLDGSMNNIYMRIYENNAIQVVPLLGIKSGSTFRYSDNQVIYEGAAVDIKYQVTFTLSQSEVWFWEIQVEGRNKEIDFIYGQDISLGFKGGTLTNELYISQYLGHTILEGEQGYVVSSRQNQSQKGAFPYMQQGSVDTRIVGYSTDAMQFFGLEYKKTNEPEILTKNLPNVNYQFEMSYIGLQTEKMTLQGKHKVTFYNLVKENHPNAIHEIEYSQEIKQAYELVTDQQGKTAFINSAFMNATFMNTEPVRINSDIGKPLVSEPLSQEELDSYFPEKKLMEYEDDRLLSFFTPEHQHVVLLEKELRVERPHGHIITTAVETKHISKNIMASTNYMYGIFNSQVVVGNTNLHKLISNSRGLLNIFKNSGQRIYIKLDGTYRLLTLPAVYELGINYSRWYYKTETDVILITVFAAADTPDIILTVNSRNNLKYEYIITNQLVMGNQEYEEKINAAFTRDTIQITPDKDSFIAKVYPELAYRMKIKGTYFALSDDRIFYTGEVNYNNTMLSVILGETSHFEMIIHGDLEASQEEISDTYDFTEECKKHKQVFQDLTCNFNLTIPELEVARDGQEDNGKNSENITRNLDTLNEIMWWYTHNAMIHFASPHGLEQPGGAAWGTRDVCQGPLEFFFATGHFQLAREIIEEIYEHQFLESGEWPQWFMFDQYNLQQYDCHGDVVFWPLKVLGDYIRITGDVSILEYKAGYRHCETGKLSAEKETILEHTKRSLANIKSRYVYDTNLINYAGGDWDDTLQPANQELRDNLVSAWTVALAYQTIHQLGQALHDHENENSKENSKEYSKEYSKENSKENSKEYSKEYSSELLQMAADLKTAFDKYLIKDDVIAGFAYFNDTSTFEYMLHPEDDKTGIKYRLIPMTRSIISELAEKQQASKNMETIREQLKCPDGVRLMNRPARYKGGISEIFLRAEQAANVGREISLQYTHAHIRYVEALAKLGRAEEAWNALLVINPINIKERVPNAITRQSNAYFSSSEGEFNNRYEFQENFQKLRTGDVKVKGGWRIYSSGPGIYITQLISHILGIRFEGNDLIIDPVIPKEYDNLHFTYEVLQKKVTFIYHIKENGGSIQNIQINNKTIPFQINDNPYRPGGCRIPGDIIKGAKEDITIDVFL